MTASTQKALKERRAEQASMAALGLPDFETAEDCDKRQQAMIRALERLGVKRKPLKRLQTRTLDQGAAPEMAESGAELTTHPASVA